MSKVKIQVAEINESSALADVAAATFTESFSEYNTAENMQKYIEDNYCESNLKSELEDNSVIYFIVSYNKQVAGYMKLRLNSTYREIEDYFSIEIERIYLLKKFHKLGLGKRLILKSIQLAKQNGYNLLWLAVWERNTNAISFYEHLGFTQFSNKPFMLGNDLQNDICFKLGIA